MISFTVHGRPLGKERPRGNNHYTPQQTRDAEASIATLARYAVGCERLTGIYAVDVTAYVATPAKMSPEDAQAACLFGVPAVGKPDLDNIAKLILDACNGVIWKDDSEVVELTVRRVYANDERVFVRVTSLDPKAENPLYGNPTLGVFRGV